MINNDWNKMNPATLWRDWVLKSEQQWSDTMSGVLKQAGTASAMGKQVDEIRMMHKQFSEMAQASLAAANMPSRTDFEMLDERMGRLEDGFAALCAEVAQLRHAIAATPAASKLPAKPTRTRKPSKQTVAPVPPAPPAKVSKAAKAAKK